MEKIIHIHPKGNTTKKLQSILNSKGEEWNIDSNIRPPIGRKKR